MTTYNKTTLKTFFETGDVPQGSDYANFIDSYVNIVETAEQAMAGPLYTTELVSPRVSAAALNVTGVLSANNLALNNISASAASFSGTVSAATVNATTVNGTTIKGTTVSASTVVAATVSAAKIKQAITIISAAGSTQATGGAVSSTIGICRLQGTADGQTTGYLLPTPTGNLGFEQVLIHEGTVSGNLWPNVGCKINALSTNGAFALAASTTYLVVYSNVSGYAVK